MKKSYILFCVFALSIGVSCASIMLPFYSQTAGESFADVKSTGYLKTPNEGNDIFNGLLAENNYNGNAWTGLSACGGASFDEWKKYGYHYSYPIPDVCNFFDPNIDFSRCCRNPCIPEPSYVSILAAILGVGLLIRRK